MQPDPGWHGQIKFHELLFGTWLSYIVLVIVWEKLLRTALPEWKYVFLTCVAASFFVINHYLNYAPFYYWLINSYTLVFLIIWYFTGIHDKARPILWKISAVVLALVYSALYVAFEMVGRFIVSQGIHEMWVLMAAFTGLVGLTAWRRHR